MEKIIWCPSCHQRVIIPDIVKNANIKGKIKLKCGNGKCPGTVTIKPERENELNNTRKF